MQGVSDAFDGVDAPLTVVLMVDVMTTAIYLGIRAFNGPLLAALLILATAIAIMILWTFYSVGCDFCKANKTQNQSKESACQYCYWSWRLFVPHRGQPSTNTAE